MGKIQSAKDADQVTITPLMLHEMIEACCDQSPQLVQWCERHEKLKEQELNVLLQSWLRDPQHFEVLKQLSHNQVKWVFIEVLKHTVLRHCRTEESSLTLITLTHALNERIEELDHSLHHKADDVRAWVRAIFSSVEDKEQPSVPVEGIDKDSESLWDAVNLIDRTFEYPEAMFEEYEEGLPPDESLSETNFLVGSVNDFDEDRTGESRTSGESPSRMQRASAARQSTPPSPVHPSALPLPPPSPAPCTQPITGAPPPTPSVSLDEHFTGGGSQVEPELKPSVSTEPSPPAEINRIVDRELTQPGPLERLIERAKILAWVCYLLMGYSALYLINLIDNLWSLLSEYISKIFRGIMGLRSALKVEEWRSSGQLDIKILTSAHATLAMSERLLCLPSLSDDILKEIIEGDSGEIIERSSPKGNNPLSLALTARAHLDDLRRDLSHIRPKSGRRHMWSMLKSLVLDLIPNPLSFIRPFLNTAMIIWRLHFSRKQVLVVHRSLCDELIRLNQRIKALSDHHKKNSLGINEVQNIEHEINTLVDQIEEKIYLLLSFTLQSRYHAQPHRWSLFDQIGEFSASPSDRSHPWAKMAQRNRLLREIVQHQQYRESATVDELLFTQRALKMFQKYRNLGIL